jgi:hypothetical protein
MTLRFVARAVVVVWFQSCCTRLDPGVAETVLGCGAAVVVVITVLAAAATEALVATTSTTRAMSEVLMAPWEESREAGRGGEEETNALAC